MSDSIEEPKTGWLHWPEWSLSEATILAVAIPYAYCLAYGYELGYASYFQIPLSLVSISLLYAFLILAIVFLCFGSFTIITEILMTVFPKSTETTVKRTLVAAFAGAVCILVYGWQVTAFFSAVAAFALLLIRVLPRGSAQFEKRLNAAKSQEELIGIKREFHDWYDETPLRSLSARVSESTITLIFFALALLAASFNLGWKVASTDTDFAVDAKDSRLVNVAIYPDIFVFATQVAPHTLSPQFTIYSKEEFGAGRGMTVKRIGPFNPVEIKTPSPEASPAHGPAVFRKPPV